MQGRVIAVFADDRSSTLFIGAIIVVFLTTWLARTYHLPPESAGRV
jgi:hypothetical protein